MTDSGIDTGATQWTRARKRLDEWFVPVVVVLLIVAGLAAVVAYQSYVEPGTETEEVVDGTWEERTSLSQQATVQRSNLVFEQNQVLSNRELYFSRISPELQGTREYSYTASDGGQLTVEATAELRLRAVDSDENVYWERTETLSENQVEGLAPQETTTLSVGFDVQERKNQTEQIQESLGTAVGETRMAVVFRTVVSGTVNGESVSNTHRDTLAVTPEGSTYSVTTQSTEPTSHQQTRVVTSQVSYGPLRQFGPFVVSGVALLAAAVLGALRYRESLAPSPAALAALEHNQQREEFDDWISSGRLSNNALDGARIELDSLEDLVDVGIDTGERVIEDRSGDVFYVLSEGCYYTYSLDRHGDGQTMLPSDDGGASAHAAGHENGEHADTVSFTVEEQADSFSATATSDGIEGSLRAGRRAADALSRSLSSHSIGPGNEFTADPSQGRGTDTDIAWKWAGDDDTATETNSED